MSKVSDLHEEWSLDPDYREAWSRIGPEFELSRSFIEVRTRAGLTQAELAERMKTTRSVVGSRAAAPIPRPEPSKRPRATGACLRTSFDPA